MMQSNFYTFLRLNFLKYKIKNLKYYKVLFIANINSSEENPSYYPMSTTAERKSLPNNAIFIQYTVRAQISNCFFRMILIKFYIFLLLCITKVIMRFIHYNLIVGKAKLISCLKINTVLESMDLVKKIFCLICTLH